MLELKTILTTDQLLKEIEVEDGKLHSLYQNALQVNSKLDRTLVSFQANKCKNGSRWCKYKEGFSWDLISYLIHSFKIYSGRIVDPFVGSGTALFAASDSGIDSVGIELLPNSQKIIEVRKILREDNAKDIIESLRTFKESLIWEKDGETKKFNHLRITAGAFPPETERKLERYLFEVDKIDNPKLKEVLLFAVMCILENVSFTRKDGQYLRWDFRAGRSWGKKPFSKGEILPFTETLKAKIDEILGDISQEQLQLGFFESANKGNIELLKGSCLDILPTLEPQSFDGLITSPPYCNRYDYTRTYALELAMMGVGEEEIRDLRQTMLSCTVENREKDNLGNKFNPHRFQNAIDAFESQRLLKLIREFLNRSKEEGLLNNNGIPRMVHNYFKELSVVIFECARILKPGARFIMVNDNVKYQGINIPVDLILSDIAQKAGFDVDVIWVLPIGKGNSSQQMRTHGRQELRKCVYIWNLK